MARHIRASSVGAGARLRSTTRATPWRRIASGCIALVLASTFAGCARRTGVERGMSPFVSARSNVFCSPPLDLAPEFVEDPVPASAPRPERLAALLGLRATYVALRADPASVSTERRLEAFERIAIASELIDAMVAELDCEGERADQVTAYLRARDARRQSSLTASSIIVGAGTSIASAFLAGQNASTRTQGWVGATGGTTSAALAFGLLFVGAKTEFRHERNLLTDVWQGPAESTIYPAFLWAYLSRPEYSNEGIQSIRARVVARWHAFHESANDPELAETLFGAGGVYDAATLDTRATMLEQVKAEIALASQDLAMLAIAMHAP